MFFEYLENVAKIMSAEAVILGEAQRIEPELCAIASFADVNVRRLHSIAADEQDRWHVQFISSSPIARRLRAKYSRAPPG